MQVVVDAPFWGNPKTTAPQLSKNTLPSLSWLMSPRYPHVYL